ncbi:hypothetical protein, partial [Acidocella sp. KAb 2-4]|uniref:hypothetical protein n=1 Tax=Acidocella sp. KAb 2-4 TaxID=2885158 RepID=UPI001D05F4F3
LNNSKCESEPNLSGIPGSLLTGNQHPRLPGTWRCVAARHLRQYEHAVDKVGRGKERSVNAQPVVIINIRGMTPANSEKEWYEIVDNLLFNRHVFCSSVIF